MTGPDTAGPAESTTTTISEEMTPSVLPPDVIPQPADSWGVQFMVDQRPDPGATELVAFVAYRECSGGKSPVGRMHDPIVLETDGSIAVALFADPLPGDMFTCLLVWDREHPLTISLLSPVAGRAIYDVGGRVMLVSAAG